MKLKLKIKNRIIKRSQKGFRGFPVTTVAYYGPDNRNATKVAVGIIEHEGAEPVMQKWYKRGTDVRLDEEITNEILEFIRQHDAVSVAAVAKLLGCPHEEGIDYPKGQVCPQCPYWAGRDRWADIGSE